MATTITNGETLNEGTTYTWYLATMSRNMETWTQGVKVALEMTIEKIDKSARTVTVTFQRSLYAQYQVVDGIDWLTYVPSGATAGYRYVLNITSSDGKSHTNIPSSNTGAKLKFSHNSDEYVQVFTWGSNERVFKYSNNGKCNFTVNLSSWYIAYSLKSPYSSTIFDSSHYWKASGISATFNLPSIDPIIKSISISMSGDPSVGCQVVPLSFELDYPTTHSRYGKSQSYLSVTSVYDDPRILKCTSRRYDPVSRTFTATVDGASNVSYQWTCPYNTQYITFNGSTTSKSVSVTFKCDKGSYLYDAADGAFQYIPITCTATVGNYSKTTSYTVTFHKYNLIYWYTDNVNCVSIYNKSGEYTSDLQCDINAIHGNNSKCIIRTYFSNNRSRQTNSIELDVRLQIEYIICYTAKQANDWNVVSSEVNPKYESVINPFKLLVKPYPSNCNKNFWNQVVNNLSFSLCKYNEDGSVTYLSGDNNYFRAYDYGTYSRNNDNIKYFAISIDPKEDFIKYDTVFSATARSRYSVYVDNTNSTSLDSTAYFEILAKDWSITNISVSDITTSLGIQSCYFDKDNTSSNILVDEIDSGETYNHKMYIIREAHEVRYYSISVEPTGTTETLSLSNFVSSNTDVAKVVSVFYPNTSTPYINVMFNQPGTAIITVTSNIKKVSCSFLVTVNKNNTLIYDEYNPSPYRYLINTDVSYNDNDDTFDITTTSKDTYNGLTSIKFSNGNRTVSEIQLTCNLRPSGLAITASPNAIPQDDKSLITAKVLPDTGEVYTTVADKYNKISDWNLTYSTSDNLGELQDTDSEYSKNYYAYLNENYLTYSAYITATVKSDTNSFEPISNTAVVNVDMRGIKIVPNELEILQNTNSIATVITTPTTDDFSYTVDNDNIQVVRQAKTLNIYGSKIGKSLVTAKSNYIQRDYTDTLNVKVIKQASNPIIYYPTDITTNMYYYTNHPKIVFKLPTLEEKLSVDDIIVDITVYSNSNDVLFDNTYSAFTNKELFSMSYNHTYTDNEQFILNTIDSDNCYCIFADINNDYLLDDISYMQVTVMFKSNTTLCNDTLTTVKVYKSTMPKLPNVNDYMLASDLTYFYSTIINIFSQVECTDYINEISKLNSLGVKGEHISVYPFYVTLKTINTFLEDIYNKAHSCSNKDSELPEYLSPTTIRTPYYSNKTSKADNRLEVIPNAINEYPIMVDDNNDTLYNNDNWLNEFKLTTFFNDYTVSPLSEINKAISKL